MLIEKVTIEGVEGDNYFFYCPACGCVHRYQCGTKSGPNWTFNGDYDKPTFSPSLLMFYYTHPETKEQKTICHLFVRDGKIDYCGDCPHDHAGKTIPMVEIPDGRRYG